MEATPFEVKVPSLPLSAYTELIGGARTRALEDAATRGRALLEGRIVWNVNSTGSGGGVAEMLRVLVGYALGAGVEARWMVIEGDPAFFAITKRIHNRIHGVAGDGGGLGASEQAHYGEIQAANAVALRRRLRPGDVVLLHDPQTAGLVEPLTEAGLLVVWRCHIGADQTNRFTEEAWDFLRPFLEPCPYFVFSRASFVPGWMAKDRVSIIPPSIDPFSPKNRPIPPADLPSFLATIGLAPGPAPAPARFRRYDGTTGELRRSATIVSDGPAEEIGLRGPVVQVSRWDRLKDMVGVLEGFASGVADQVEVPLALVGPSTEGVTDDPEGAEVYAEVLDRWQGLERPVRRKIVLVTLPMGDTDENAAMVNAIQRASSVIVQKSLVEGFGLTVAEGMWKSKPVVGSRVGGIADQIAPGTGFLLDDPTDLDAFGETLLGLLARPRLITRMGAKAYRRVLEHYVGDHHLLALAALLEAVVAGEPREDPVAGSGKS